MQIKRVITIVVAIFVAAVPAVEAQQSSEEKTTGVVITIGAKTTAAGFAGDDQPRVLFPTVIGYPKADAGAMIGMGQKNFYVGDEAMARRELLDLVYPVRYGRIVGSSEEMRKLLHHVFYNELRVAPEEHRVFVAISDVVTESPTRNILSMLFDEFNVEAAYIESLAVLSVYASGRTTGLAVNMTHEGGNVVPVVEGSVLSEYVVKLPRGIDHQSIHMNSLLRELKIDISDELVLEDIVATQTYVAVDYDAELDKLKGGGRGIESTYVMPDGTTIKLERERFMVPETLFNPSLVHHKVCALPQCIGNLLERVNPTQQTPIRDVVLSGTASLTPGLPDRLRSELQSFNSEGFFIKVIAAPEREHSHWIGGSILASISTFQAEWVSKKEYSDGSWQQTLLSPPAGSRSE